MALVLVQFKPNPFNLILFYSGSPIKVLWHERGNVSYIFYTLCYATLIYTHISLECSHMCMFIMHSEHNKLVYYYCYTKYMSETGIFIQNYINQKLTWAFIWFQLACKHTNKGCFPSAILSQKHQDLRVRELSFLYSQMEATHCLCHFWIFIMIHTLHFFFSGWFCYFEY